MMLGFRYICARSYLCGLSELLVPVDLLCDVGFRVWLELFICSDFSMVSCYLFTCSYGR
jgi:hypothetical protein